MKTGICLFSITTLLAAAALAQTNESPIAKTPDKAAKKGKVEVCFVLDTTGSMGSLIEGAKQKIWSIANDIAHAKPAPEIRLGLVGYRDRGDEYVTRVYDLTNDIDFVYSQLQSFRAGGGGDTPESVNEALQAAVDKMSWSGSKDVLKIIFLVGDAPPHMDYKDGPRYPDVCQAAMKKDLLINTVQCGTLVETTTVWKDIARLGEGNFAAIAQSGNMVAVATPMDRELSELNTRLGSTLVAYGDESVRRTVVGKQAASVNAPASVAADRLAFNSRSGVAVQGEGELLDAMAQGKVKSVRKDYLPAELQSLDDKALQAELEKRRTERAKIQAQIKELSQKRENYLRAEQSRNAGKDSFDGQVAATIQAQGARKGLVFGE